MENIKIEFVKKVSFRGRRFVGGKQAVENFSGDEWGLLRASILSKTLTDVSNITAILKNLFAIYDSQLFSSH